MSIPIDSTDARELRELEEARAADEDEKGMRTPHAPGGEHDDRCRGGWLGEDDEARPIPCPVCRPWLAHGVCRTCGAPFQACESLRSIRRGPCCDHCDHARHHRGGQS